MFVFASQSGVCRRFGSLRSVIGELGRSKPEVHATALGARDYLQMQPRARVANIPMVANFEKLKLAAFDQD